MNFKVDSTPEFDKDFKHLAKKYKSLESDFETFEKALAVDGPRLTGAVRIAGLGKHIETPIYKARKFYCQQLHKRNSGFRVIYAHLCNEDKLILLEFYHKNKQTNENRKRISGYFGKNGTYRID